MKKTAKQHEEYLNELYSETLSPEEAVYKFDYLTSPVRKYRTTRANIIKQCMAGKLGTLLRKLDPIAFNCSMND